MCIGSNGLYSGSGLTLKSCVTNDCTSYLESSQINNYAPSMVYAQGCGLFSNGSNNYNPTPSTPPSYIPPVVPAPTPVPSPVPQPGPSPTYTSPGLNSRISILYSNSTYGYANSKAPLGKPTIVQLAITESKDLITGLTNHISMFNFVLFRKVGLINWLDVKVAHYSTFFAPQN